MFGCYNGRKGWGKWGREDEREGGDTTNGRNGNKQLRHVLSPELVRVVSSLPLLLFSLLFLSFLFMFLSILLSA
jgi:hypothetical protein